MWLVSKGLINAQYELRYKRWKISVSTIALHSINRVFLSFIKRILSGHLFTSVAVCLSLRRIYCEFGENRNIHKEIFNDK